MNDETGKAPIIDQGTAILTTVEQTVNILQACKGIEVLNAYFRKYSLKGDFNDSNEAIDWVKDHPEAIKVLGILVDQLREATMQVLSDEQHGYKTVIKTAQEAIAMVNKIRATVNKRQDQSQNKSMLEDEADLKPLEPLSEDIQFEAEKILRAGHPVEYIMKVFHKDYVDGDVYGRLLLHSQLCGTCTTTKGVHPSVNGPSTAGKTEAMLNMANLNDQAFVVSGMHSPKSILYNKQLRPGSTIVFDDVGRMSESMGQLIKIMTSKYQESVQHHTVYDGVYFEVSTPPRINFWKTGVDVGCSNAQYLNREVNVGLEAPDGEHAKRILNHQMDDDMIGRPVREVTREVLVCRAIHRSLLAKPPVAVFIPWLKEDAETPILTWRGEKNPRLYPIFGDLIKISASIHRYQRPSGENGEVIATVEDFDNAMKIWNEVGRETFSKLNKNDQLVIQGLRDLKATKDNPVDKDMLADHIKKNRNTVYEWLHGRPKEGVEGITSRCSAVVTRVQTETEYDQELTEGPSERVKKTGSKSVKKYLVWLAGEVDIFKNSESIVSLDKERAEKILAKYCLRDKPP